MPVAHSTLPVGEGIVRLYIRSHVPCTTVTPARPIAPSESPASTPPHGEKIGLGRLEDERLHAVLVALQRTVTQAAVGAARSSMRLQAMTERLDTTHQNVSEISHSMERIQTGVLEIREATRSTAELAQRVDRLTGSGQDVSRQAIDSTQALRDHMEIMTDRLRVLMDQIQAITQVSEVIAEIAGQTNLLALNAAIEAARAGDHGRGFAVVADEVRKLSEKTAAQTKQIRSLIDRLVSEMKPAHTAIDESMTLLDTTVTQSEQTGKALGEVYGLVQEAVEHTNSIASAVEQQTEQIGHVFHALQQATEATGEVKREVDHVAQDTFALSELVEDAYVYLGRYDTGTVFHRSLALARELAGRSRHIMERVIDEGRCTLRDMLALDYTEIKGPAIRSLSRLFDVRRVPDEGFDPPKYSTTYDALVDQPLQQVMDEILQRESSLIFALIIDLNSYAPIHNSIYCKDWTGDPKKDLVGNRIKRFFFDQRVLVRGARVGLGDAAMNLPNKARREDFERAGCNLREPADGCRDFLVQTYARDTGAIVTVLTVPIYVKGHRYGAALLGWNEDGSW